MLRRFANRAPKIARCGMWFLDFMATQQCSSPTVSNSSLCWLKNRVRCPKSAPRYISRNGQPPRCYPCASLGFIQLRDGDYSLTQVSEDYLVETSPTYFGAILDFTSRMPPSGRWRALGKGGAHRYPQIHGSGDLFKSHEEQAELARIFTRGMHSVSMSPAMAWPEVVDLSQHHVMLDIGGRLRRALYRCDTAMAAFACLGL